MNDFREKVSALINTASEQANSLLGEFNNIVNSFEIDEKYGSLLNEKKNDLISKSNKVLNDFSDLLKQVKDNFKDMTIVVPFNEDKGEKFTITKEGNRVTVEVKYEDEKTTKHNKTSVFIGEECDWDNHTVSVNKFNNTLTLTIPKKKTEGDDAKPTFLSKLEKKLKENEDKFAKIMENNGMRFVRRNP